MSHYDKLVARVRDNPQQALELITGLVNQYCDETKDGRVGHCFMSDLEAAFDFLELDAYKLTRQEFWDLICPPPPTDKEPT
jgi:hypothetical protein